MIKPTTPETGPFKTKVIGKFNDQVREQRVEKEENYEYPFKDSVDENKSKFVCISVQHGCKFVGSHG